MLLSNNDFSKLIIITHTLANLETMLRRTIMDTCFVPTEADIQEIAIIWKKYREGAFLAQDVQHWMQGIYRKLPDKF